MNEQIKEISVDDAKSLLASINRQNKITLNTVRVPMWLNVSLSILVTWIFSFDYINHYFELATKWEWIPFFLVLIGSSIWYVVLRKRGMKVKVFALNKLTILVIAFFFLIELFYSDLLWYLHDNYNYYLSFLVMLCFASVVGYLGYKYPLPEAISEE